MPEKRRRRGSYARGHAKERVRHHDEPRGGGCYNHKLVRVYRRREERIGGGDIGSVETEQRREEENRRDWMSGAEVRRGFTEGVTGGGFNRRV